MLNAMDIVDNCNLRCPILRVRLQQDLCHEHDGPGATLEAVLRFLPYTLDSNFWFSCLHEPALHPDFTAYLNRVPGTCGGKSSSPPTSPSA